MTYTREELAELHSRSVAKGSAIFLADVALFLAGSLLIVTARHITIVLAGSVVVWLAGCMLFLIGHDTCHQSFTPSRWLNRLFGTLAFLPTLHPFSLWDLGHNRIHHRYTSVRGLDYVWEPLTPGEYAALPPAAQRRYCFFRTFIGHGFYYLAEIWWTRMWFPRRDRIGGYRPAYRVDLAIIGAWAVLWPAMIALARARVQPHAGVLDLAIVILLGCVLPFLAAHWVLSVAIYLHHTHPDVGWRRAPDVPLSGAHQIAHTVHLVLPWPIGPLLHHGMEHGAHHLRAGIPMYHLARAQAMLEAREAKAVTQKWTLAWHLDTLRLCQVFDVDGGRWEPIAHAAHRLTPARHG